MQQAVDAEPGVGRHDDAVDLLGKNHIEHRAHGRAGRYYGLPFDAYCQVFLCNSI
jgi:hypothetical protein